VVAEIRERLTVNEQGSHKFHMEMFSLRKLHEVEGTEKYHVEVSNRLQLRKIWMLRLKLTQYGKQNIKISAKECLGYYELKNH
jgi:hypothetical protein